MTERSTNTQPDTAHSKREGMAMLIVMLVLLAATATATFAMHATTYEMRASGYGRQALQTRFVAESGLQGGIAAVDAMSPASLEPAMTRSTPPILVPFEPNLLPGKYGYRMYLADFATTTPPIETDPARTPSLGPYTAYRPQFILDINDSYTFTRPIAGDRADGSGALRFLAATYTSRGRTPVTGSDYRTAGDTRDYHEGAADARAHVVLGPLPR